MTKITEKLVEGGVIVVEAPKAEYSVPMAEAELLDSGVQLFADGEDTIFDGDQMLQKSALITSRVLGTDCTYVKFNTISAMWIRKLMARSPNLNEDSARRAWNRHMGRITKETGFVKPKAPSNDAKRMSAKRSEEAEKLMAMGDDELVELMAGFVNQQNFDKAKKVKAELNRRHGDVEKQAKAELKELREQIRKQLAQTADIELLRKVSALLPKLVNQE